MKQNYSVLMSVYKKEKPEYLRLSMQSMWEQTIPTNDFVLVCDGPLTEDLNKVISDMEQKHQVALNVIRLDKNQGLGPALAAGLPQCKNELIARMDSDDISLSERCEIQLKKFENNQTLDICGSNIVEFDGTIDNVLGKRIVPLTDKEIKQYQKKRCAFNHMTVMYKKSVVLNAGNYQEAPLMEDDYMWVRMFLNGAEAANIDECLVYARTGKEMIARRGGWEYFKKYKAGRKKFKNIGYIGVFDYYYTLVIQFIVALMPVRLRMFLFIKFLRA